VSAWRDRERERRLEQARYWEQRERIELIKKILGVMAIVVLFVAASAGMLYGAVRLIRAAWGAS
jgi:hypothetical protein